MLLIPALRKAEACGSVSSRPAWFTRASSRIGFKTTEKVGLKKPKKGKKISSCICAQTTNKAASNHQNMLNSDMVGSLMFRHRVCFMFSQSSFLGKSV